MEDTRNEGVSTIFTISKFSVPIAVTISLFSESASSTEETYRGISILMSIVYLFIV